MKACLTTILTAGLVAFSSSASAQRADFNLTYHVERTPAAKLSIETCGRAVVQAARQSKVAVNTQSFPGQLVVVSGGIRGAGAFTAQCITVGTTTVSVVQGIDYKDSKGSIGAFADRAFADIKKAVK